MEGVKKLAARNRLALRVSSISGSSSQKRRSLHSVSTFAVENSTLLRVASVSQIKLRYPNFQIAVAAQFMYVGGK